MTRKTTILLTIAMSCLNSNGHAQVPSHEAPIGNMIEPDPEPLPPEAEERAEDLQSRGKCLQAIPIFRRLAEKGTGYEISQFNLGTCLFQIGSTEANGSRAASLKHEAVEWIIRAANAGFPNAETSLISVYLDGNGAERDPIEAAKWSFIYHENEMRRSLGLPDISTEIRQRLNQTLNEKDWSEAQSRAVTWSRVSQGDIRK